MTMPQSRTLPGLVAEMAGRHPARNAITDQTYRCSYGELADEVRALARSFRALGVREGDKVALLMENRAEWLQVYLAVTSIGGVLVALNTWWRQDELSHALDLADVSVLVMVDAYLNSDYVAILAAMGDRATASPMLKHVVCLGEARPEGAMGWAEFRALAARTPEADVEACSRAVAPDDVAMIIFTSGTTSKSKGVPLLHRGLIENMFAIGERMHLTEADRLLLVASLYWGFGLNGALAFLTHGASIVLQRRHDPQETLRLIEAERCTALYAVPNLVRALHEHPDRARRDLSTLRTGEARNTVVHLMHEMGATEVCTMYGLSEGYANSSVSDGRLPLDVRRRISGRPLPNTQMEVVDPDTHRPLPCGELGELRIRGYVTRGYYKNPELFAKVSDSEGWFYTGDLATMDAEGGVEIKGRLKELIKTGGISVTPADVEALLLQLPQVQDAVVVGLPDPERDEVVAAMVVLKPGAALDTATMIAFCRANAAAYKVPRYVEFVPAGAIPVTINGKVDKIRMQKDMGARYAASARALA